jgi:hypothetical protein
MKSFHEGQLVTIVGEDEEIDGIVVHAPSLVKVEVAVPDSAHGTVFRTVHRMIRRAGSGGRGGPRTGPGAARRGHSHPSGHRTTGK